MQADPIITLLTDFGTRDAYVGIMKGVILKIAPTARLVDLSHEVPPQAVTSAALLLSSSVRYFAVNTVHLAVVDPGVGSARAPVLVVTDRGFLVGPDNGLLHPAAETMGVREVRRLENDAYFLRPVSQTFHGRDIFAPVAAHLAAGVPPKAFGPTLADLRPLALPEPVVRAGSICGQVIHVDVFGNLVTNISADLLAAFAREKVSVSIGHVADIQVVRAYAEAPEGAVVAIVGSWNMLEVAVRNGHAASSLRASAGAPVTVKTERREAD